jgi:hypothetical protein
VRKWIVIAVVVLGIALVFVLKPKRDPIEYHKRAFLTAHDEGWVERTWNRLRGGEPRYYARLDKHEKALLKLGYLERREFVVTNISSGNPMEVIGWAASTNIGGIYRITKTADPKSKVIIITGLREDMPKWEKLIGELQSRNGK